MRLGVAELDPVHLRVGEQAVEQDHRPALPDLVPGELDAVGRGPMVGGGFSHFHQKSQKSHLYGRARARPRARGSRISRNASEACIADDKAGPTMQRPMGFMLTGSER